MDYLSQAQKNAIILSLDSLLMLLSFFAAFALLSDTGIPWDFLYSNWPLYAALWMVGVGILWLSGLHRINLDRFCEHALPRSGGAAIFLMLSAMALSYMLGVSTPPSILVLMGILFWVFAVFTRIAVLSLRREVVEREGERKPVAIYGAGALGVQLAISLRQSRKVRPAFFIDDDLKVHGQIVAGLPVFDPDKIPKLVERNGIEQILLADPSTAHEDHEKLISKLDAHNLKVTVVPAFEEGTHNGNTAQNPRPVAQDQPLDNNTAIFSTPDILKTYAGRIVMVTGAGRAVGSELCRQLLKCGPAKIILFEQGELQLRAIHKELEVSAQYIGVSIVARLGSVTDNARVAAVIAEEGVDIILHAAVYQNASLIEENELEGARNNVFGTQVVAEAAAAAKLERFILVSPDKNERSINITSATNRMAELVLLDMQSRNKVTRFATVRAGNLLGLSESDEPLFQKQNAESGPSPVIHKDLVRSSIATPEAAGLAVLAGAYAKGGDVFVFDIKEPQKVSDTSHRVIVPFGRRVEEPSTAPKLILNKVKEAFSEDDLRQDLPSGDDNFLPTPHPRIRRVQEAILSQIEVASMLRELQELIAKADTLKLRRLIADRVPGYHFQSDEGHLH